MNISALLPWLKGSALLCLFLFGMKVQAWHDGSAAAADFKRQVKAADTFNAGTATHTQAAATHIEAIHATHQTLGERIQAITFTQPAQTAGGPAHATFAPALDRCPDYLAAPEFQRLYDSGSAAEPAEAGDLPPPGS